MTLDKFNELGEQWIALKNVPKGGFFRLSESETAPVWERGEYCRSDKKFYCNKYDDMNHESAFKPHRMVWVGFIF